MILNETPVRTSQNFKANNIEIADVNLPESVEPFLNRTIYINSEKKTLLVAESLEDSERLNDLYEDSKILVSELTKDDFDLKYSIGEEVSKNAIDLANQKLRIVAKENTTDVVANIEFAFDKENLSLLDNIEIYAEKNSKIDVTITYIPRREDGEEETIDNNKYYHNGIIKVCALDNAIINLNVINLLNYEANNFISYEIKLLNDAKLNSTIVDFGGKNSISNYYADLFGKSSVNNLNSIYLGAQSQLFDLNYIAHCRGEKSDVNFEVQGALTDSAIKHFKGTIDFKKGCKKAKGNENENCLLLSDNAKSLALPVLLCSEEDVEGNHSTSSGKAEAKELFYLMSRGLTEKDAMKLLVRARFNSIIEKISNKEIEEVVTNAIDKKL